MYKPGQIFYVNESGIPSDHHSPYVLTRKKVGYYFSGNKGQVTVVGCINTLGQALPPFVVFDAKNLNIQRKCQEQPTDSAIMGGWIWFCLKNDLLSIFFAMLEQIAHYFHCLVATAYII